MQELQLVVPAMEFLPSYVAALERGWSPDNIRGLAAAQEELEHIRADAAEFVSLMVDREAKGPRVVMPDGSTVPRIPGYRMWAWDGEFCGSLGFRWQPGTAELPAHVLGHIGYAVVPWKQGRGIATRALALLLDEVRKEGLPCVEITTDLENLASQKVLLANGAVLIGQFRKLAVYGTVHGRRESLKYRIDLRANK
jgi:predicted acetyltransferase